MPQPWSTRTRPDEWDNLAPTDFRAEAMAEELRDYLVRYGSELSLPVLLNDFVTDTQQWDDLEAEDFDTFMAAVILFLLQLPAMPKEDRELVGLNETRLVDYPLLSRSEFAGQIRDARTRRRQAAAGKSTSQAGSSSTPPST